MKITAIRIRILRSRPTGYGHDAAEIEAQVEYGDDPLEVAAVLRRMCEAEVRRGEEASTLVDMVQSLRSEVARNENALEGLRVEAADARQAIREQQEFIRMASEKGVPLPASIEFLSPDLPF
jgi:hypothetical protein